jgi:DNA-binding response OmpR family regulator
MLTARDSDIDYITGITLGSDDYFTKPFSPMALVMRVKAMFRRINFEKNQSNKNENSELKFGNLNININNKIVSCNNSNIDVTPNEYNLLTYLFENKDRAISREELLNKVWGYHSEIETRAADDTVKRLRKKIIDTNVSIETVWGFGFRLKENS